MEGTWPGGLKRVRVFLEMIKFEHTVFALPFCYMGMLLGAEGWPGIRTFTWMTLAMVGARTLAMTVNRLADRDFDARNPRTADRALPRGLITPAWAWTAAAGSLMLFELAAFQLNLFVFALSPIALVFLLGYHYVKRFSWTCHWILGLTGGLAAAGGWAAVRESVGPPAALLTLAVMVWMAGFDLIYACQDVEVDRREGLHSFPARFGVHAALVAARINHVMAVAALAALGWMMVLGWPYWVGVVAAAVLLIHENRLVQGGDISKIDYAFFNMNGYIAMIMLLATVLSIAPILPKGQWPVHW